MRELRFFLGLAAVIFFHNTVILAAETPIIKEEAISLAFKEEAIREAFQEAEISILSQETERDAGSFNFASHLHPYFRTGIVYTDNVWLIKDNVQSDFYLDFVPGVKFTLGEFEESYTDSSFQYGLEVDLGAEITHSLYRSVALNRESPYAGVKYTFGSGRNKFSLSHYFESGWVLQSRLTADTTGLAHFQANNSDIGWEYSFNRFGIGLGYKRDAYNYYKSYKASNTKEDNMASLIGFFKVTPKSRLFLEYNYGQYKYPKYDSSIRDYNYNKIWVGGQGNFTSKLSGFAKVGFQNTDYSEANKVKDTMTIDAGLSYKLSPKNTLSFSAFHGDLTTDYTDQGMDERTSFKLGFAHNFSRRLNLSGNLSYVKDNYDSGRDDDTYGASISLNYAFREWMQLSLGYDYDDRKSTQHRSGYTSNSYYLKAELAF